MTSESAKRTVAQRLQIMALYESGCGNFILENILQTLLLSEKRIWGHWAAPTKMSHAASGVVSGSGVTGQWQLHLQLILSGVALDAVSSNSTQYVWSSSKFLNWFCRSVNHKCCESFLKKIVLVLHRSPFSSPENLSLGFLIKLPLVFHVTPPWGRLFRYWRIWARDNSKSVPSCQCCLINTG